jgi:hypothetical protein
VAIHRNPLRIPEVLDYIICLASLDSVSMVSMLDTQDLKREIELLTERLGKTQDYL